MPAHDEPVLPPPRLAVGDVGDAVSFDLDAQHEPQPVAPDEIHLLRDAEDPDRFAWRARIRANPAALFWYRIGVGFVGGLLMVAAALTGWLPGPGGIPLFLLGLAVWASEFSWANGVLMYFKHWFDRLQAMSTRQKRAATVVTIIAILATWYAVAAFTGVPTWLPDSLEVWLRRLPGLS